MTEGEEPARLAALYAAGDYEGAFLGARRLIASGRASSRLHEIEGAGLMGLGRAREAAAAFVAAIGDGPPSGRLLYNLGCALLDAGEPAHAADVLTQALALAPRSGPVVERLGAALLADGRPREALSRFEEAAGLAPGVARAHDGAGLAAQRLGDFTQAAVHHRRAADIAPDEPRILNNLGVALQNDDRDREALPVFAKALALAPGFAEARANMAISLEALGRLEEARAALTETLAARPDHAEAHRLLSGLTRYTRDDAHLKALRRLWDAASTDEAARVHLGFALGKALIDVGEDEAAFAAIEEANRLRRRALRYDQAAEAEAFARIRAAYAEQTGGAGCGDASPIFIVGMPRSGTSLAEQILASHPDVEGGGELPLFHALAAPRALAPGFSDWEQLGADYVAAARARGISAARFTDKAPLNFRWLGAIARALPEARLVHCVRDARDVCCSIWRNHFAADGMRFAYDQREIAFYYGLYREMMAYWEESLGARLYRLDHARLVADQEGETRRLLAFCGLDFNPACLDFTATARAVKTLSAAQVRAPLNDASAGLWRRFETGLQPMLGMLTDYSAAR